MMKLFKIEWIKISRNRVFWITLAFYVITIVLILLGLRSAIISINENMSESMGGMTVLPTEIYRFPHVWHNLTFISKYIKIFIGILMILIVSNEFYYNTLRQNIINGMTRMDFIKAKFIDGVLLALFATFMLFIFGLTAGLINTKNIEISDVFSKMEFIPGYFLLLTAYLTFIMMLTIILKKAILTIGVLFLYEGIIENILIWKLPERWENFLPINAFNGLIVAPKTQLFALFNVKTASNGIDPLNISVSVVYIAVFIWVSYIVLKKRDL